MNNEQKGMHMKKRVLTLVIFCIFLSFANMNLMAEDQSGRFDGIYELFIPALSNDGGPAYNVDPQLVLLEESKNGITVKRMWPALYYQKYDEDAFKAGELAKGLVWKQDSSSDKIQISGIIVDDHVRGYWKVLLRGQKKDDAFWTGHAEVNVAGYFHLSDNIFKSEWSLQPAKRSMIYDRMLNLLNFIRREPDEAVRSTLKSKKDYREFLRSSEFVRDDSGRRELPIAKRFRELTIEALNRDEIQFSDGRFSLAQRLRKSFEQETNLKEIDINVTSTDSRPAYTPSQREIENSPRFEANDINRYAKKSARWRDRHFESYQFDFINESGCTWDELKYVPGIAFLSNHMAGVPEDLRDKIAKGAIHDGSLEWFRGMTFDELAAVPKPVLLAACLPHMKEREAKKLAETERVKNMLEWGDLDADDIYRYSIPELVALIVENCPADDIENLLDIPKMVAYLKDTESQRLKEAIMKRGLQL